MSDEVVKMMVQHQAEMRAQMMQMQTRIESMATQLAEVHACTVTISATRTATGQEAGGAPGVDGRGGGVGESKSAYEPGVATGKGQSSTAGHSPGQTVRTLRPLQLPGTGRPAAGTLRRR